MIIGGHDCGDWRSRSYCEGLISIRHEGVKAKWGYKEFGCSFVKLVELTAGCLLSVDVTVCYP